MLQISVRLQAIGAGEFQTKGECAMNTVVLRALEQLEPGMGKRIRQGLEMRLGHSLDELSEAEQAFVEREMQMYFWVEGVRPIANSTNGVPTASTSNNEPTMTKCPSCNEQGLIQENGCSRCVLCGFGKCDV